MSVTVSEPYVRSRTHAAVTLPANHRLMILLGPHGEVRHGNCASFLSQPSETNLRSISSLDRI